MPVDGLVISNIGGYCPVQAEGTIGDQEFYFRARGDSWRMSIGGDVVCKPDWTYREHYGTWPEAGYMSLEEATKFIEREAAKYLKESKPK